MRLQNYKEEHIATLLGILAILLWSTSIGLIRSITEAAGAVAGGAMIYSVSGAFLLLVRGVPDIKKFSPIYLFGCGFFFVCYEILLSQSIGLAQNDQQSLELGLVNYLWPCLTILFAVLMKQQRSHPLLWIGILISFVGIVWIVKGHGLWTPNNLWMHIKSNPVAYLFAFFAAITWALYCNLTKIYGGGQNGISLFLVVVGIVLWSKYFIDGAPTITISVKLIFELMFMAVSTSLGYSFWNYGIQKGSMPLLATASYFTPLLSTLLASLWLGASLSLSFWQSVMMVTLGSLVCWLGTGVKIRKKQK